MESELQRVCVFVCVCVCVCVHPGVCFQCLIDVVPVKNEDGLVIMFILNFELPSDPRPAPSSPSRELNQKLAIPWLTLGNTLLL